MVRTTENKPETNAAEQESERTRAKVRWDGSKMRSTYANVCNVSSTREEVTLLFGTNQTWHAAQKELTVELSDRIILNPYAAKRLSKLLNAIMQEYESRFGELQIETGEKEARSVS
jgi:hypothetical protein